MKNLKEVTDFLVKFALVEDVGSGDITSKTVVARNKKARARIIAKEKGVIAGLFVAKEVFKLVDHDIKFLPKVSEGTKVKKGKVIAEVFGPARGILTAERTALNFLQHLSGVATLTAKFVERVKGMKVKILDTRKTIPGLRVLEKYAVRVGGGVNHRMGLYDAFLIKDNHIKLSGGIKRSVESIRRKFGRRKEIEVEAKTIEEVEEAIEAKVDRILLDNMNLKTMRRAVKLCQKAKIETEASGGVKLQNVRAIAKTGVDYISVGALTHSASALDISLKVV